MRAVLAAPPSRPRVGAASDSPVRWRFEIVLVVADVAPVEDGVLGRADIDEGRLHPGQHVLDPTQVDVAVDLGGVVGLAGDVVLDQGPSLEHGDLGGGGLGVDDHQVAADRAALALAAAAAFERLVVDLDRARRRARPPPAGGRRAGAAPAAPAPPAGRTLTRQRVSRRAGFAVVDPPGGRSWRGGHHDRGRAGVADLGLRRRWPGRWQLAARPGNGWGADTAPGLGRPLASRQRLADGRLVGPGPWHRGRRSGFTSGPAGSGQLAVRRAGATARSATRRAASTASRGRHPRQGAGLAGRVPDRGAGSAPVATLAPGPAVTSPLAASPAAGRGPGGPTGAASAADRWAFVRCGSGRPGIPAGGAGTTRPQATTTRRRLATRGRLPPATTHRPQTTRRP